MLSKRDQVLLISSLFFVSIYIELHALLLNDVLVLLERHDEKYHLRCHTAETVSGSKEELSPVIRLQECLLRHAAHDRGQCYIVNACIKSACAHVCIIYGDLYSIH